MADPIVFHSPVAAVPSPQPSGDVSLADLTAAAKFIVYDTAAGVAPLVAAVAVGHAGRAGAAVVAAVSPGEWLVLAPGDGRDAPVTPGRAVDVSHARVLFRLSGPAAAATLAKVCALDFDDRFMPGGAAARTSVAKTTAEVLRLDRAGEASYLISCGRSFGSYLHAALVDAADEYGGTAVAWDGAEL